jgi:hypothetical protein
MAQGRPKTVRIGGTGEKLYMALKLNGMSWGTRVGPNHVTANPRWAQCGLPRSINTVIEDIRSGIPIHRLDRYAGFFHVPADLFADGGIGPYSADFSCEILKNKNRPSTTGVMDTCFLDFQARKHVQEHNGLAANYPLYQLLFGVYRIYYKRDGSDIVYQGVARTEMQTEFGIGIAAAIVIDGIPVELSGAMFRWNNFIHIQYHSEDYQVLGYLLGPNPMDSVLLRRRSPFYLKFCGLAGNLEISAQPDRYELCIVKETRAEGQGLTQAYEGLLEKALREPALYPPHALYASTLALFAGPTG